MILCPLLTSFFSKFMKPCSFSVILSLFFPLSLFFLSFSPFFVGARVIFMIFFPPQAIFIPPPRGGGGGGILKN